MARRHWRLAGAAGALLLLIALTGSRVGAATPGRGPQVEHYTGPLGATATPLPLCTVATSTPYPTATPYPTQPPYYCFPRPTQPPYPTSTPYPCPYCPTSTLTPTWTPTDTPTLTPSPTPTWTPTATPTYSGLCILVTTTPYPTYTPLPTLTRRPTVTPCLQPSYTPIPTYTPNPTYTPTGFYPTPSPFSGTPSPTPLPSSTSTPPPTATSCLDCFTPTATKTATAAGTATAASTATSAITPSASATWPPPTHQPCAFPPCITDTPTATASPAPTNTPCTLSFADVHATDYFYTPVQYLACHGVISGYADGTFRPYNNTTRAQMVKIVVLGFGRAISTPAGGQSTFADVPPAQPFYAVIETAAADGIVSGYTCGRPGEPCDAQGRPYFRSNADVTRGQLSKIVVATAGWALQTPAGGTFADVAPGSAFYPFVETAACHGIVSGYSCGGPGEPCDAQGRPYFRPGTPATRGQIAKIVYGALTVHSICAVLAPP